MQKKTAMIGTTMAQIGTELNAARAEFIRLEEELKVYQSAYADSG